LPFRLRFRRSRRTIPRVFPGPTFGRTFEIQGVFERRFREMRCRLGERLHGLRRIVVGEHLPIVTAVETFCRIIPRRKGLPAIP
jgi:hypothetical protein